MEYTHNNYLNYELPEDWCAEYTDENLNIYNPNGKGAMTLSFYSILETDRRLYEQISIMGNVFVMQCFSHYKQNRNRILFNLFQKNF